WARNPHGLLATAGWPSAGSTRRGLRPSPSRPTRRFSHGWRGAAEKEDRGRSARLRPRSVGRPARAPSAVYGCEGLRPRKVPSGVARPAAPTAGTLGPFGGFSDG